jgi:flagellar basal body-associated protein FliL
VRKWLAGTVLLGLSIAIPATFSARVFVLVIWIIVGAAAALWVVFSGPVLARFPWRVTRKNPAVEGIISRAVRLYVLRNDLQTALRTLMDQYENATPAQLRAFGNNLAARLRDDDYDVTAAQVEVQLPDNAERTAIQNRRSALRDQLIRLLIWDEYE